ncbi:hypothetical protein LPJ61_003347 [Coemansia biformis]|uniref:SIS domain-containing protein n=1 Tax=Coemansia biformis TaxID=1286918 RepID=A0A9W7Y6R0_9FUNG|nr:hypothetical protein LPJ61_003347 [Coemansia biformis]
MALPTTDGLGHAIEAVADALDMVSLAVRQHADLLRRDPRALQPALEILLATVDTLRSKVVVTGIGKSFLIGKKLAATLTSVGTHAISLHATEALHGDMGIIGPGDCVLALSYSGETEEVVRLVSILRAMQRRQMSSVRLIGMGRSRHTPLGELCDAWIGCPVGAELSRDVCAPTVSSSLMLAIGDAIAIMLMNHRRFDSTDFARNHPGGHLGRASRRISQPQLQQLSTPPLSTFGCGDDDDDDYDDDDDCCPMRE